MNPNLLMDLNIRLGYGDDIKLSRDEFESLKQGDIDKIDNLESHIDELECNIQTINYENEALESQVEDLEKEIKDLEKQLKEKDNV